MADDVRDTHGPAGHRTPGRLPISAGLCATCRFQRLVTSGKGSAFSLCLKSETDPRFPRYPALPVLQCGGYELKP